MHVSLQSRGGLCDQQHPQLNGTKSVEIVYVHLLKEGGLYQMDQTKNY